MRVLKMTAASALAAAALSVAAVLPAMAEEAYQCRLYGRVTDAGQVVSRMEIDYGRDIDSGTVDPGDFNVHVKASSQKYKDLFSGLGMNILGDGDYEIDRKIVKTEVAGSKVTLFFDESEGGTVSYIQLDGTGIPTGGDGRNFPMELSYTVTQKSEIKAADGNAVSGEYVCDNTVHDPETERFVSVMSKDGLNYQYHKGNNGTLIVWFHGNGEGDQDNLTQNNISQMLANRGTVAWASDEAQKVLGDATVMAFQTPVTWYRADQSAMYSRAYDEIQKVVRANNINPAKIIVAGCSAGGYMTTNMVMRYPGLFKAAVIICPATNVRKVEPVPTDEQLAEIASSNTRIWLVQGASDSAVGGDTSERIFNNLTAGREVSSTSVAQENSSGFVTYETADGKYKRTVYDTNNGKITCAEDYNQDGVTEPVQYSDHWTWIYALQNNPKDASGTSLWQWLKKTIG